MKSFLAYSFTFLLFVLSSCRKEGCVTQNAINYDAEAEKDDGSCRFKPYLGEEYRGGVCYLIQTVIDASDRFYIAAKEDLSTGAPWGCSGTSISYSSSMLTAGLNNTLSISNECGESGIAAKLCLDYSSGTHSDWILPSDIELEYFGHAGVDVPGIIDGAYYWSSTETSATHAIAVVFTGTSYTAVALPKTTLCRVRPTKCLELGS